VTWGRKSPVDPDGGTTNHPMKGRTCDTRPELFSAGLEQMSCNGNLKPEVAGGIREIRLGA